MGVIKFKLHTAIIGNKALIKHCDVVATNILIQESTISTNLTDQILTTLLMLQTFIQLPFSFPPQVVELKEAFIPTTMRCGWTDSRHAYPMILPLDFSSNGPSIVITILRCGSCKS